jgi:mRNA-degrading endonuclease RelE of RelBE toxin-antitoxin system
MAPGVMMAAMSRTPSFSIRFDPLVKGHLNKIEKKHHSLIRTSVHDQLAFQPLVETRNRKPLQRPVESGATWELRLGPGNRFRVLYSVDAENQIVNVLAVGVKDGNRLVIGGKEVQS